MTMTEVVRQLNEHKIFPYVEDGKLKTKSSKSALTPELVKLIKSNKDALIAFLSQERASETDAKRAPIPVVARDADFYPLSFAQQRLWLVSQVENTHSQYNVNNALVLEGDIDLPALQAAFDHIIQRHEILRCTYHSDDGTPVQQIQPVQPLAIQRSECFIDDADAEQNALRELAVKEAQTSFDLSTDLMLRVSLVSLVQRNNSPRYLLLLTMHHIASDGWSMGVLTQEFVQCYQQAQQRATTAAVTPSAVTSSAFTPNLPELSCQYVDFAVWQREKQKNGEFEQQLNYWQKQLNGLPTIHGLPLDKPRPAQQCYAGDVVTMQLESRTVQQLTHYAQQHGGTLFMLLETAFALLISRWSRESDIVIGTPIAGRMHNAVEPLIGFFVNTLVLRTQLTDNETFAALFARNQKDIFSAFDSQDVPFETLVELLQPERSASYSPLFQVMFALQNNANTELTLPKVSIAPVDAGETTSKFELNLICAEGPQGLLCYWNYSTAIFNAATISAMADSFCVLLTHIATNPNAIAAEIPLVSVNSHELRAQQQARLANTAHEEHMLAGFMRHVASQPDAIALVDSATDERMTYAELAQLAQNIAVFLDRNNYPPKAAISVFFPRCLMQIASLLGIMLSGRPYLSLDVNSPTSRNEYIVADAQAATVLTTAALYDGANALNPAHIVVMDAPSVIEQLDAVNAQQRDEIRARVCATDPNDIVYFVYTSGTTGKPKGTLTTHRNASHFTHNFLSHVKLSPQSIVTNAANIAWDAATLEVWMPFTHGAQVVLVQKETYVNPQKLAAIYRDYQVTFAFVTTAILHQMAAEEPDGFHPLDTLCFGGEKADIHAVNKIVNGKPPQHLINCYGPTESTVIVSGYKITSPSTADIPIGDVIDGVVKLVLDDKQLPVPKGMQGELYLGGHGVVLGYHGKPELTDNAFVNLPALCDGKVYRTGDLVREDADGNMRFVGRVDDQVKLRGFRIELTEISANLTENPAIAEAFTMLHGTGNNAFITAYMTTKNNIARAELEAIARQQCEQNLPDYMRPSCYIALEHFPINANSKIDKRQLPVPEFTSLAAYVAPETHSQEKLQAIWAMLLKRDAETVSCDSNFFAIGGHSLLATRMVSQIQKQFGVTLSVKQLFELKNIRQIAARIEGSDAYQLTDINVQRKDQPLPLSFSQSRLWFIDQMQNGSPQYNMQVPLLLKGELHIEPFRRALNAIVLRHQVLRAAYVEVNGEPMQLLAEAAHIPLAVHDWRSACVEDAQRHAQQLQHADLHQAFDLSSPMMLRASVAMLPHEHVLVIVTQHHVASDGWSTSILLRELQANYQMALADNSASIEQLAEQHPPLTVQYADFATWQREQLTGDALQTHTAFWQQTLAGMPELHGLPLDHPRPAQQSFKGATVDHVLPMPTLEALRALATRYDMSLFMLLETLYAVLVYRYSGNDDIVIGSPIAGRNHPEVEPLIGFFVNNLVLRTQLAGEQSFAALFAQQKQHIFAAFAHQHIPFEMLVEIIQPERDPRYNPLFQLCFALQNLEVDEIALPGLAPVTHASLSQALQSDATEAKRPEPVNSSRDAEGDNTGETFAKFDLNLIAFESDTGLMLQWNYASDLFERRTIEQLASSFERLVNACLDDPTQAINACAIVDARETERLLRLQTGNTVARDPAWRLQDCVEHHAQRTPDALALHEVFSGRKVSYQALNTYADQLATQLIARGVAMDSLVVVSLPRCIEALVAYLAILKAGAGFVPVDPAYPIDRIEFMLQDSQAELVLCTPDTAQQLALPNTRWFMPQLDNLTEIASDELQQRRVALSADHVAYAIYSSGSTGQPKASLTVHKGIGNMLHDTVIRSMFDAQSFAIQTASSAFDASIYEWGSMFTAGGHLLIVDEETARNPQRLDALGEKYQVTHGFFAPSMLASLTRACWPALRVIGFGGESCSLTLAREWAQQSRIFNLYGPSEVSIVSVCGEFNATHDSMMIGHPVDNLSAFVMNAALQLQPQGCVGELVLAGVGLARGYWQRDALNASQFTTVNIGDQPQRVYRTGDLVRMHGDGQIEYMGRVDDQVKIRGLRIELGEIEAALASLAAINSVVVLALGDGADKQLVAFVQTSLAEADIARYCRTGLNAVLPAFMLPNRYVHIEQFTLTPNGKIDKRHLAAMELPALTEVYLPPQTDTEKAVQVVWAEVLKISAEQVGLHSNFFSLGGHSLLAAKAITALQQRLAVDIPLRSMFEHESLRDFAQFIRQQHTVLSQPIEAFPAHELAPLSFAQQRLWVLDQIEGGSAQYNMPFAFELTGELNVVALNRALCQLIQRHHILRTCYRTVVKQGETVTVQQVLDAPTQVIQQQHCAPSAYQQRVQQALQQEAQTAFDLAEGPVLRAQLISSQQVSDMSDTLSPIHALLLTMHHIAADGWSMSVFTRELMALYHAACTQTNAQLPDLPIQYRDFAAWQQAEAQQQRLQGELEYWRTQLDGLPTQHSLPLDFPRPAVQDFRSARHIQTLSAETTQQLQHMADAEQMSLFMLLQGMFASVIARWSGESDVVIGTPIAGRNRPEVESLIGCFINSLVLRNQVDESLSMQAYLRRSKALMLDAYEHQHVSFEHLVEILQPERSLNLTPLFQIMLVMQNNDSAQVSLENVNMRALTTDESSVKYDLNVSITPYDGQLLISWNYATSLFTADTIARLAQSFARVLGQLLENNLQTLAEVAMLPSADASQWQQFNQTDEHQVHRQHPITVQLQQLYSQLPTIATHSAVIDAEGVDTYHALFARAAWFQQQLPAGNATASVAIYSRRHRALLAAMVAVLASGHSYTLIEPSSPAARVAQIVEMTSAVALITDQIDVTKECAFAGDIPLIALQASDAALTHPSASAMQFVTPALDDLAYLIFTSGSTGVPKGVMVPHRGLSDYCAFASQHYYARPDAPQRLAGAWLVTSHGFDISVPSLWLPLLHGDTVTLLPDSDIIEHLAARLQQEASQSVLLRMTPSHVQGLLALLADDVVSECAHAFIIGGEAFKADDATALQKHFPQAFIVNHYGPSETVVGSTWLPLNDEIAAQVLRDNAQGVLPVGRPMSNTKAYVVSPGGQLQPVGCVGELWISGDCVTAGYLQQPELTADKFVANPFVKEAQGQQGYSRCYRTGDAVRFNGEVLTFIGRIDNQIKLHGFRIEASEIEAALCELPDIQQAAVAKHPEREQLAAWLVFSNHHSLDVSTIQQALSARLPSYMLPSAIMPLDALPLSANGKVNYRALPAIVSDDTEERIPAENAVQAQLMSVWSDVLGVAESTLSITDNFFAVGGNSIQAIRLVTKINQLFACEWRAGQLFACHSIRKQAQALQRPAIPNVDNADHWISTQTSSHHAPTVVLVHPVGGDISAYPTLVNQLPEDWCIHLVAHPRFAKPSSEYQHLPALAAEYCDQLVARQPQGPYHLAGWSMGGLMVIAMARILAERGIQVASVTAVDSGLAIQEAFWQELQMGSTPEQQVQIIHEFLAQHPERQAQFDAAYQVSQLAAIAGVEANVQRTLMINNLVAIRDYQQHHLLQGQPLATLQFVSADHAVELLDKQREAVNSLATQSAFVHVPSSNHFSLLSSPQVNVVADVLQRAVYSAPEAQWQSAADRDTSVCS